MKNNRATFLEKVTANIATTGTATLIAASSGAFVAPLLPVLTSALASGRYRKRVEEELLFLNSAFEKQEEKLKNISDSQFKLINDSISAIFHNVDEKKLEYLRNAAINAVSAELIESHESIMISRVLRDISTYEIIFLSEIIDYTEIIILSEPDPSKTQDDKLYLDIEDDRVTTLSGLVNLGLVVVVASGFGGTMNYHISTFAEKVLNLVQKPKDL